MMDPKMDERIFNSAKTGKKRRGQMHLLRYLEGGRLTQRQAITAKCYDCNGMGESDECDIFSCSLYPYSQFRGK